MKILKIIILSLFLGLTAFAEETYEISLGGEVSSLDRDRYYNFGSVRVNDRVRAVFTLYNNGRIPIYIRDIDLKKENPFFERNNCPRILFEGDRCRIRVVFAPKKRQVYNTRLEIDLSPFEDLTIHLRGRGVRSPYWP